MQSVLGVKPTTGGVTLRDASDGTLVISANISLEAVWISPQLKLSDVPVEIGPYAIKEAKLELAGDSEMGVMGVCILSNDSGRAKAKTEQLPAASPSPKIRSLAPGGRPPFDRRRHAPCPLPLDPASLPS